MATKDFCVIEQQTNTEENTNKLYFKLKNEIKVTLINRNKTSPKIEVALDIHIDKFYYISMHFRMYVKRI